jgi:hypothetical protein
MIPKHKDPGYLAGDEDDTDPLERCLRRKEDYQSIRAFPLGAGEAVCFTHRTLHWGSRGSARESRDPRMSLALAFSDPAYEPPYFSADPGAASPSLALRLALVCGQMICYHERFCFDAKQLNFFKKCFDIDAEYFHDTYRRKVCSEFIAAVIETQTAPAAAAPQQPEAPSRKRKQSNAEDNADSKRAAPGPSSSIKKTSKSAKAVAAAAALTVVSHSASSSSSEDDDEGIGFAAAGGGGGGSEEDEEEAALEAAMDQILDGDRDGTYFVGGDDYEDSSGGSGEGEGDSSEGSADA